MDSANSEKLYFKIGEVAEAAGVNTSVLRFWESEFSFLKPAKSRSGQRLYSRNEVELILQVKDLLYKEKFTIQGVRNRYSKKGKLIKSDDLVDNVSAEKYSELLKTVREDLRSLREIL